MLVEYDDKPFGFYGKRGELIRVIMAQDFDAAWEEVTRTCGIWGAAPSPKEVGKRLQKGGYKVCEVEVTPVGANPNEEIARLNKVIALIQDDNQWLRKVAIDACCNP